MEKVRITLSLDDETYRLVRIKAATAGKSMSRWLSEFIEAEKARADAEEARREALTREQSAGEGRE